MQQRTVVVENPPPTVEAIVFAADGAGDFRVSSSKLRKVIRRLGLPIRVHTFIWSHGYYRVVADQCDSEHRNEKGAELAAEILDYHHKHPNVPIHLWGHSAGVGVILACLEKLPAGVVDQAFLLAPSASMHYDLRPALHSLRGRMHVFYSNADWFYSGVVTRVLGTTDRLRSGTGARFGFRKYLEAPADHAAYAKLVQRPWSPEDEAIGNDGGHFGMYAPGFIQRHILPLIAISNRQPAAGTVDSQLGQPVFQFDDSNIEAESTENKSP